MVRFLLGASLVFVLVVPARGQTAVADSACVSADINSDGIVNTADFLILVGQYGSAPPCVSVRDTVYIYQTRVDTVYITKTGGDGQLSEDSALPGLDQIDVSVSEENLDRLPGKDGFRLKIRGEDTKGNRLYSSRNPPPNIQLRVDVEVRVSPAYDVRSGGLGYIYRRRSYKDSRIVFQKSYNYLAPDLLSNYGDVENPIEIRIDEMGDLSFPGTTAQNTTARAFYFNVILYVTSSDFYGDREEDLVFLSGFESKRQPPPVELNIKK